MSKKRLLYLDNLKVCLTVLVIFHHAGQAYGDGGDWAYHPSNPAEYIPWIWHFFSVNAAFFMGLFFLISGYFVPTSFDKQGTKMFVQKELIRLGIPLLLMGGLLSVLTGKPEIGHMWYIESLLVFCLIYALIRLISKPINDECTSRPTIIGLLIFGGIMGIGSYLILQYVMMFVIGILTRRFAWLEKMGNTTGIYESLLCVFICFGLLWLFREYGNWGSRFWQWCAAQSYGAYIFHLLLMIVLQYATDGIWMGAFGKFMFIGIITTICSFVLTWLVRLIPGAKKVL